jgi:cysteinyl-tRNA synthetase
VGRRATVFTAINVAGPPGRPVLASLGGNRYIRPMTLALYDTMARAKRPFVPVNPERVTMYVCGPTVYNYAHIGNARPVVAFDVLFRLLRHLYGAEHVVYAANVTDVDDKINLKAAQEGVPIRAVTDRYLAAYNADMAVLGALTPTLQPRATQTMDAIIAMIGRLVRNNAAYAAEGHVLFNTQTYVDYGKLSGRSLDDMIAGARVDVAPYKQHPADFVLWKPSKPGEPVWESPFGPGRPGWHIECSAMIEQALGLPIDIHGGGNDLIFPHHENELAQGMCADHVAGYANYWLHNGFLNMGAQKMSKSLGNVQLVHDLIAQAPGEALRWALLASHYRQPLAWTDEVVAQARAALDTLYGALRRSADVAADDCGPSPGFLEALCDDLNTPRANAELFSLARRLETGSPAEKALAKGQLLASGGLAGFLQADPEAWFHRGADKALAARVEDLIARRVAARAAKDWPTADAIRAELTALNVEVMDNATGATWRLREPV